MRDHDDEAVIGDLFEKIHDLDGSLGVQGAGGLIGEKDLGVVDKSARDRDTLHLSAGHLVGLFVGLIPKADLFERVERHLSAPVGGDSADRQRQFDVLQD